MARLMGKLGITPPPPHPPTPVTQTTKKTAKCVKNTMAFSIAALLINDSSVGKVGHTGQEHQQVYTVYNYIYCGMPLARWQDLGSPDQKSPKNVCIKRPNKIVLIFNETHGKSRTNVINFSSYLKDL